MMYSASLHPISTSLMYRRVSSHCQEEDGIRWQSKKMCAHLLLRELQNYNLLLNNHQLENVGSHQKKIPHIQGQRRSPRKMVGGANLHLELNPLCTRDAQRTQTNLVSTSTKIPQKDWAKTVFECLQQRYRSAVACHRNRGSTCSRHGFGISPLVGGHH